MKKLLAMGCVVLGLSAGASEVRAASQCCFDKTRPTTAGLHQCVQRIPKTFCWELPGLQVYAANYECVAVGDPLCISKINGLACGLDVNGNAQGDCAQGDLDFEVEGPGQSLPTLVVLAGLLVAGSVWMIRRRHSTA